MTDEFIIPDPWECIKCGMCCQRYDKVNDVIVSCQYLNEDKSCLIYEDRPLACRLDYMSNRNKIAHCNISIASILSRTDVEETISRMVAFAEKETNNG
jgi:Fe-S-cluster containining protein